MKATETNLIRFLQQQDTQFIIPVYQRNYDWTRSQCEQLLDDILQVGSNKHLSSHFIGSIVYIHDDVYSTATPRLLTVIDGQQRLTTITLIWIVLYREAKAHNNDKLLNEIYKKYLVNEFLEDDEKLKLRPTVNNDKALKYLLRDDEAEEFHEYSRLIENFIYFKSRINAGNFEVVMNGIAKLMFVEISLEREKDDPQRIFESLNSTGLDLSQADLIRNYILMGLEYSHQNKIYEKYWYHIEILATEDETNRSKVSDFIRDFLTLKFREIPNKNKVYQEFKSRFQFDDFESLETVMGELKKFVQYYNKLINPDKENDREIREQVRLINKLEINVSYPFILEVYDDYANNLIEKKILIKTLELIQSFVWRRFIVGLPTNALNKIFMRLYEDVDSADYLTSIYKSLLRKKSSQRFPNDDETIRDLKFKDVYGIQAKNKTYFLERLENYDNREPVQIEDNPDITIEHIFPRNPDPQWKIDLGEEEYNEIKENYLNTIGNLTLSGNNGVLGNKPFIEKRDLPDKGYGDSRLFLNKHLSSLQKWDIEEINKRFEIIVERFKKIWQYPEVTIDENGKYEEINVFEEEDPTGKTIDYIIFFDQKAEVASYNELYHKVISFLFETQPETFFTTDLGNKLKLSKSGEMHRNPLKITETYYIEANLSARDILKRIQHALSTFKLFDDLYIKFK